MPAGQVVQITINVSDGNAAEAVQQVVAQLNAIGPAGEAAGAAAGAGLDQVSEHALSSKENVRLLSEEMGIHVPRAMQSVIAIGGADILINMGERAVQAYDKWVLLKDEIASTAGVVKMFEDATPEAMQRNIGLVEDFIRATQGEKSALQDKLLHQQNDPQSMTQFYDSDLFKKAVGGVKEDLQAITGASITPSDLPKAITDVETYRQKWQNVLTTMKSTNELIEEGRLFASGYSGQDITRAQEHMDTAAAEERFLREREGKNSVLEMSLQNQVDTTKPGTEADQHALATKKETDAAIRDLDEQALEATLSGIDLLEAQRKHAEHEWVRVHGASVRAIQDINEVYLIKEIDFNDKQAGENTQKNDKIADAQKQFNREMDQIGMRSDDAQVSGYARIAEEAGRSIAKIQEDYQKLSIMKEVTPDVLGDAQTKAAQATINV
jgi:hypothetical protein